MARGIKTGGGSRKGIPNKATADVRACMALIAERNILQVEAWLAAIEDPAKRLALFLDLCEYHIPKLARTEMVGKDGGAVKIELTGSDGGL